MANQNNDLQSMELYERMNTINGENIDKRSFKQALNKWLIVNKSGYSGISLVEYEPAQALAIINDKSDHYALTATELLNEMVVGNSDKHKYTSKEALNKIGTGFE